MRDGTVRGRSEDEVVRLLELRKNQRELIPRLQEANRAVASTCLTDATARYHLYQDYEEYKRHKISYNNTNRALEAEGVRPAREKRLQELACAKSAYDFAQNVLGKRLQLLRCIGSAAREDAPDSIFRADSAKDATCD